MWCYCFLSDTTFLIFLPYIVRLTVKFRACIRPLREQFITSIFIKSPKEVTSRGLAPPTYRYKPQLFDPKSKRASTPRWHHVVQRIMETRSGTQDLEPHVLSLGHCLPLVIWLKWNWYVISVRKRSFSAKSDDEFCSNEIRLWKPTFLFTKCYIYPPVAVNFTHDPTSR